MKNYTDKKSFLRNIAIAAIAGIVIGFSVASFFAPPREESRPEGLEVRSWNMEWFPSGYPEKQPAKDEARRMDIAARDIRRAGVPDIMFVQEIRDLQTCSNLCQKIGDSSFYPAVCSRFAFPRTIVPASETNEAVVEWMPGYQQCAILTRLSVVDKGNQRWGRREGRPSPPRGFSWAVLETPQGKLIAAICLHLKSNYIPEGQDFQVQSVLNTQKRELSAEQVLDFVAKLREKGVNGRSIDYFIVAGDFNTSIFDDRYKEERTIRLFLENGWSNALEGIKPSKAYTLPKSDYYPAVTYDYILVSGDLKPIYKTVGARSQISDHSPVVAVF